MSVVYLDTMLYVYSFNSASPLHKQSSEVVDGFLRRPHQVVASLFIHGELLVLPERRKDEFSIARIHHMMSSGPIITATFSRTALETFVDLRANFGVKAVDALHLATAAKASVDLFVTNDSKLLTLSVAGIGKIVGMDEALQLM